MDLVLWWLIGDKQRLQVERVGNVTVCSDTGHLQRLGLKHKDVQQAFQGN